MKWFRFYNEALTDSKVQQLPGELFKTWVNILCLASKHKGQIPIRELSQGLSHRWERSRREIDDLVRRGLLELGDGVVIPHNWYGRQYKSDSSAERVRRHRERKSNVTRNVSNGGFVTAPDKKKDLYLLTPSENEPREEEKRVAEEASKKLAASPYLASVLEEKGWVRR